MDKDGIPSRCATVQDLACGYGFTIFAVNEELGQLMGTGVNKDGQIRKPFHFDNDGHLIFIQNITFLSLPLPRGQGAL